MIRSMGRGGGQVVSVLAFYSDDTSSNPAEVYSFSVILCLKRTKINKNEAGVGPPFKNKYFAILLLQKPPIAQEKYNLEQFHLQSVH